MSWYLFVEGLIGCQRFDDCIGIFKHSCLYIIYVCCMLPLFKSHHFAERCPFFESLAKNNARCTSLFSFVDAYSYIIQDSDSVA